MKPKTKAELLQACQKNFQQLNDYIASLSDTQRTASFAPGSLNRNIRDVLAHLHHWHYLFLDWYQVGMRGKKPDMPAKGYTWKATPELNRWIWENYQEMELEAVQKMLQQSYKKVLKIIEKHSEEELFEKRRYAWTNTTSLGAYLISNTASHYAWGIKVIRKGGVNS